MTADPITDPLAPPTPRYDYVRDPDAIYRESFATIRAEADLSSLPADARTVAVRMIHASGEVDLPAAMAVHPRLVAAARTALEGGATIFTDAEMTASGVTRRRLPADNPVRCLLHDPRVPELAKSWRTTRTAAAVSLWGSDLAGAVVAFGNAPTALFQLLELDRRGRAPACGDRRHPGRLRRVGGVQDRAGGESLGHPVPRRARPPGRLGPVCGRRQRLGSTGGDLVSGRLFAVGVGPGDPELLTLRAARLIGAAGVIAYHSGPQGSSIARTIVADLLPVGVIEELLRYPVTTGASDHPDGYYGAMAAFYDASAARLAVHLDAGRDVVVLAEGDPLFYSSYGYLHERLAARYPCQIVPGVTSLSATSAAVQVALGRHEDVLTVLPGTLSVPELASRLAGSDAVMIMKLGRTYAGVLEALRQSGRLAEAVYVERASTSDERVLPAGAVDPASVPYFSMIMVPGRDRRADGAGRAAQREPAAFGSAPVELVVVGVGPGGAGGRTAEAEATLASVQHVVGYRAYLERLPARPGQVQHPSGNTVEVERARFALDLALRGERVAVVSGGDAGVFGMASAVFEAAEDPRYAGVGIRVVPGVTAAQAVAARAGAPLGADFAVLSLSDRLKSWTTIERRVRAAAESDLVIAIYNPASRSRTTQLAQARELLLEYRPPDTPVIIGRDVGRDGEQVIVTTLAELDPDRVDMQCLLIIGAAGTSVTDGRVWTRRSVPTVVATR